MNTPILYMPASDLAVSASPDTLFNSKHFKEASIKEMARRLNFQPVSHADMPQIWNFLKDAPGRTTDFSYAGLLMWVDFFNYEFAILNDTLFIKGRVESDRSKVAFSLPLGRLPLDSSVAILKEYCNIQGYPLVFSAIPEELVGEFTILNPKSLELLADWSDYLYDAEALASLRGKKLGKKRNHVNQFNAAFPDAMLIPLSADNVASVESFMDLVDAQGDDTPMAIAERSLNRYILSLIKEGDSNMIGAILTDGYDRILGFTIGDIKGDTLFIHIEKALKDIPGGFEMINKSFAAHILASHPEIKFINREDDAGDPGLRHAKQSYHPLSLLRKFNISF